MNKFQTLIEQSLTERSETNRYDMYSEDIFDSIMSTGLINPTEASKQADSILGAIVMLAADAQLPETVFQGSSAPMQWAFQLENKPLSPLNPQQHSTLKRSYATIIGNLYSVSNRERNMFDAELREKYNQINSIIKSS